ncbi:hypothetical protein [Sulfurimonas sp.]|uniref:hypothetical protein n=1 Tax=Sulfurimonas sp. TaxID=2022749 RepID=UPI003D0E18C4
MKTFTILISLFVSTILLANSQAATNPSELSWVDEQIEAIKPSRSGATNGYLGQIRDPFIFLDKEEKKVSKTSSTIQTTKNITSTNVVKTPKKAGKLTLEAIINHSALIDGKWYKEGQNIYGYKVAKVDGKNVLLKKSEKNLLLTTKSKRSLKFNSN